MSEHVDAVDLEVPTTVAEAVGQCLSKLQDCLSREVLKRSQWAENCLAEFRLWIDTTGALAGPKACLDARLEFEPEAHSFVRKQLVLLFVLLEDCLESADRLKDLDAAKTNVQLVLDQLSVYALAVRKAGTGSRIRKADKTFNEKSYTGFFNHLAVLILIQPAVVENFRIAAINPSLFSAAEFDEKLDKVQLRLINANLRRRHRFIYAQQHSKGLAATQTKLPARTPTPAIMQDTPATNTGHDKELQSSAARSDIHTGHSAPLEVNSRERRTDTTASVLEPTNKILLDRVPPSQQARTNVSATLTKVVYPRLPAAARDGRSFKCPACCQALPSKLAEPRRWRTHLAEDILPYVCVLNPCPQPRAMFLSKELWLRHMNDDHQQTESWNCVLCDEPPRYDLRTFTNHVATRHADSIEDIEEYADICELKAPLNILSCPLCRWAEDQKVSFELTQLLDHIAEHVHSFALYSLPWSSDASSKIVLAPPALTVVQQWLHDLVDVEPDRDAQAVHDSRGHMDLLPPRSDIVANVRKLIHDVGSSTTMDDDDKNLSAIEQDFDEDDYFGEDGAASSVAFASTDGLEASSQSGFAESVSNVSESFNEYFGQMPNLHSHLFIGRESELEEMKRALTPGRKSRQVQQFMITGTGGIGKTQLIAAYINRHRDGYGPVFWLNASSRPAIEIDFQAIAQLIPAKQKDKYLDSEQAIAHVHRWLSDQQNNQWLLVFDNCDSLIQYELQKYYPSSSQGTVICASRLSYRNGDNVMAIQSLSNIDECREILATRSGKQDVRSDPYGATLAHELAGFPLTLATAGAYVQTSGLSFERYYQKFKAAWSADHRDQHGRLRETETVCSISYAQLQVEYPANAQLLRLLAYFNKHYITYKLLFAGNTNMIEWLKEIVDSELGFGIAMETLLNYGFVEVQERMQEWSIHPVISEWLVREPNHGTNVEFYKYAFDCVASSIKKYTSDQSPQVRVTKGKLAAHAAWLLNPDFLKNNLVDSVLTGQPQRAFEVALLLRQQKWPVEAELLYLRALEGYEKALGPEHPSTFDTAFQVGRFYEDQGKLAESEQMFMRALAGREKARGLDHTSTIDLVNTLGHFYLGQGKLAEAERMWLRALSGREKALGLDHEKTLNTVDNLGRLYKAQGRLTEAEQMYTRSLTGREKLFGLGHWVTLDTVNRIGHVYLGQGRLVEAEETWLRALSGREKALGLDHEKTLNTVENLGRLYAEQGKLEEAEYMYTRALAGREKVLGTEHTSTLDTVNNLGRLYAEQGKLEEAEYMYTRALAGREKVLRTEHLSTLDTVKNLGSLYARQGKLAEAQQMYTRALRRYQEVYGLDHQKVRDVELDLESLKMLRAVPKDSDRRNRPVYPSNFLQKH